MKKWSDGYIKVNGIEIHYYRTGGNKPQVVLNHGVMDDGLCWTRVVKKLEQDYDVIMLDARGHGLSDSGKDEYNLETQVKDLAEAIKFLNLNKPVVGGHSMGARISLQFAALYPEMTRAIFLEDPTIAMPGEPIFGGEMGEKGIDGIKMMSRMVTLFKVLPVFMGKGIAKKIMPVSPDDEIIPWIKSKKRFSKDFLKAMKNSDGSEIFFPDEVIRKLKVPTLLFMGDREKGSVVSKEVAQKMAEIIPDFKVVHLKGANHDIRRSKFDEYMASLQEFLKKVYN